MSSDSISALAERADARTISDDDRQTLIEAANNPTEYNDPVHIKYATACRGNCDHHGV